MDLIALLAAVQPYILGAASLLLARLFKIVPDVHAPPGPVAASVDAEITAFAQYLLKVPAGLVKLDDADIGALKAAKVSLDAALAGK